MAMVFEAFDENLQREVAVKILKPELASSPRKQEQFLAEAKIMAQLEHPGIAPIYELGRSAEGECFYSMKKIQGRTLKQLLDMRKPEEIKSRHLTLRLLATFERICQAVAYAHIQGIVHHDIKPSNVMLDDFGEVYLMDWGIAKALTAPKVEQQELDLESTTELVIGSPAYMSPEQAVGSQKANDFKADVFMLGIVLYEILTGERPFSGNSPRETLDELLFHEPTAPRLVSKSIPQELSAICMKALKKDPKLRYATAQHLANDIQNFREFRPVTALKPTLLSSFGKWTARHSVLSGVLLTIFIIGLLSITSISVVRYYDYLRLQVAYQRLRDFNDQSAKYNKELEQLKSSLTSDSTKSQTDTQYQIEDTQKQILMKHVEIRRVLSFVFGLTNYNVDDWILREARKEQFFSLEYAFSELKDYALVKYIVQDATNRYYSGNLTKFSKEEFARIKDYGEKAAYLLSERRKSLLSQKDVSAK